MPVNIECSKKMGISDDIVDTTVSLGTSFHKDGSVSVTDKGRGLPTGMHESGKSTPEVIYGILKLEI